jgi:hypothetical protein
MIPVPAEVELSLKNVVVKYLFSFL